MEECEKLLRDFERDYGTDETVRAVFVLHPLSKQSIGGTLLGHRVFLSKECSQGSIILIKESDIH